MCERTAKWQEEAICSVCLDLFDDPVILDCGHNVCLKCAEQLSIFNTISGGQYEAPRRARHGDASPGIRCPECRKPTPLPTEGFEGLKRNLTLRNLVARLQAERKQPQAVLCGICEEAPAACECQECGFELCAACCATQHQRGKYKSHTVVPLGQWTKVKPEPCPQHNKDLDLYCVIDQCAVCIYCLQLSESHRGHQMISMAEAVSNARGELAELVTGAQERLASIKGAVDQTALAAAQIDEQYTTVCQGINEYFAELVAAAQRRQKDLLQEVLDMKSTATDQVNASSEKMNSLTTQLQGTLANCESRLRESSHADLLRHKQRMVNRLRSVLELPSGVGAPTGEARPGWQFLPDRPLLAAVAASGAVRTTKPPAPQKRKHEPPPETRGAVHPAVPEDAILSLNISSINPPQAADSKAAVHDDLGNLITLNLLGDFSQGTQDLPAVIAPVAPVAPEPPGSPLKKRRQRSPAGQPGRPSGSRWELKI